MEPFEIEKARTRKAVKTQGCTAKNCKKEGKTTLPRKRNSNAQKDYNALGRSREYLLQALKRMGTGASHCDQSTNIQYGFLNALKQQPELASQKFTIDNESRYPLSWLIYFKVNNITIIRTTYNFYPRAIDHDHLLHWACKTNMKTPIIKFLAKEFPTGLSQYDADNRLPLHYLMRRRPIEAPRIIQYLFRLGGEDPLQHALAHNFPEYITNYIIDNYPKDIASFTVDPKTLIDQHKVMLLERILPQLKSLKCNPREWADSLTYQRILECVTKHRALLDFRLSSITHEMQHGALLVSLQKLIEISLSLKKIEVDVVPYEADDRRSPNNRNNALIMAMSAGLEKNKVLRMVVLSRLSLTDISALNKFICLAPSGLVLSSLLVDEGENNDERHCDLDTVDWKTCRLQFLKVQRCAFSCYFYDNLARQVLPKIPMLKRLDLEVTLEERDMTEYELNLTEALSEILRQGKLHHLSVKGEVSQVDVKPICEILRTDSTLTYYDVSASTNSPEKRALLLPVLKNNTTLKHAVADLKDIKEGDSDELIWYLTALNKYGRKIMRDTATTRKEFLSLLGKVNDLPADQSTLYVSGPYDIDRAIILYGLLRESPSTWINGLTASQIQSPKRTRKRKRGSILKTNAHSPTRPRTLSDANVTRARNVNRDDYARTSNSDL